MGVVVVGSRAQTAFITSLHIMMRMRRGETEQRKPNLRVEVFFSVDIYNDDAETRLSVMQKKMF